MAKNLPNLGGVRSSLEKLRSAIEDDAAAFIEQVETVNQKRQALFGASGKASAKLGEHKAALAEIETFIEEIDQSIGDNGGPASSSGSAG